LLTLKLTVNTNNILDIPNNRFNFLSVDYYCGINSDSPRQIAVTAQHDLRW